MAKRPRLHEVSTLRDGKSVCVHKDCGAKWVKGATPPKVGCRGKRAKAGLVADLKPAKKAAEVVDETEAPAAKQGPGGRYVEVGSLAQGELCVNWGRHDVMEPTGRRRDSQQMKYQEVELTARHDGGERTSEWWVPAHYPVLVGAAELQARICADYERMRAVLDGRGGAKTKAAGSVEVVDEETGEVTRVPKPKAPSRPRAALDPATGCQAGTSGHQVGLIILKQKPGKAFDRSKAIAEAVKTLKMDKGLASSWVSTLIKRKPAFVAYQAAA